MYQCLSFLCLLLLVSLLFILSRIDLFKCAEVVFSAAAFA
jgi:hypothetical protein